MDILEELKYYCEEEKPAGALMLTGEWGCGKTYYLENVLKTALKDTHVLLRISLFGMASVEDIKNEVKRSWLSAFTNRKNVEVKKNEKIRRFGRGAKNVADKSIDLLPEPLKSIVSSVLNINVLDFVDVKPEIGDKRVVLIFDDLERTEISMNDLLGCINDYCENIHINTIIVANEKKIKENDTATVKYSEMKEKIVQRTIVYRPDYESVVDSVINDIGTGSSTYKEMLFTHKQEITAVFSGKAVSGEFLDDVTPQITTGNTMKEIEEENEKIQKLLKKRPHNIRSLKCALQDFRRVYEQLEKNGIEETEKWLLSFLPYVVCMRAGIVRKTDKYGDMFEDQDVSVLYPGFYDSRYITASIKKWIKDGEWNQKDFEMDLSYKIELKKAISLVDKVRLTRLMDLEDIDLMKGYSELLELAYNGKISLDDYVFLLWNYSWGRMNYVDLPQIKWTKLYAGADRKINEMIESGENQPRQRKRINKTDREYFIEKELYLYDKIEKFLEGDVLIFEKNRRLYLDNLENDAMKTCYEIKDSIFDRFDMEMADVTANGFEKCSNREKNDFCIYFYELWKRVIRSQDYKIDISVDGMQRLKTRMEQYQNKCHENAMQIAEAHTKIFIDNIEKLIFEQKLLRDN